MRAPAAIADRRALLLRLALLLVVAMPLGGCMQTLLDQPYQQRETVAMIPPLFTWSRSPDRTSSSWSALLWMIGHEVEGERSHTRVFPFYWHNKSPYRESTLVLPFWYSRTAPAGNTRFYSLLYGYIENGDVTSHYVLAPIFYYESSRSNPYWRSGTLLLYDWRHYEDGRNDFTLFPILGLAHLFQISAGLPPEGETVGALGRSSSRRMELLNLLGFVSLAGYDDVGDTRDIRFLTLISSEQLSLIRSWRQRGGGPFVREWVFPLYMNIQDPDDGWYYVGPLWGKRTNRLKSESTNWWALGLLSRKNTPTGNTWKVLGLPVWSNEPDTPPPPAEGDGATSAGS